MRTPPVLRFEERVTPEGPLGLFTDDDETEAWLCALGQERFVKSWSPIFVNALPRPRDATLEDALRRIQNDWLYRDVSLASELDYERLRIELEEACQAFGQPMRLAVLSGTGDPGEILVVEQHKVDEAVATGRWETGAHRELWRGLRHPRAF